MKKNKYFKFYNMNTRPYFEACIWGVQMIKLKKARCFEL